MRVSVCLGAILIPQYLDFHSGYSAWRSIIAWAGWGKAEIADTRFSQVLWPQQYFGKWPKKNAHFTGKLWSSMLSVPLFACMGQAEVLRRRTIDVRPWTASQEESYGKRKRKIGMKKRWQLCWKDLLQVKEVKVLCRRRKGSWRKKESRVKKWILIMASGIQRRKEEPRGKENESRHFSEPAVFVTKVAKKNSADFLV